MFVSSQEFLRLATSRIVFLNDDVDEIIDPPTPFTHTSLQTYLNIEPYNIVWYALHCKINWKTLEGFKRYLAVLANKLDMPQYSSMYNSYSTFEDQVFLLMALHLYLG